MNKSSVIKLLLFIFAIYANVRYLLFILNPAHADNFPLFALTSAADTLAIVILTSTWSMALFYEFFKSRYYDEIQRLRKDGNEMNLFNKKVAILITVVNEDLGLVSQTIDSLIALEGRKRIYILDDGRRADIKNLSMEKNGKVEIVYLSRVDRSHNKAGNLNFGLRSVTEEFVVVVDADFKLNKEFLKKTLPLFSDETIGAVQTPQVYYNEDSLFSRGSKNLQTVFYSYILPGKTLLDSAFCTGTNVMYRKKALDAIGGIPQVDHSEDVFTSLKLLENKYKTFYLNEELALGLAPSTLISFYNQQFRWAKGGLTMIFKYNTLFNKKLTIDQRFQFFLSGIFYLSGISVFIYIICPLIAVFFNITPINGYSFTPWFTDYILYIISNLLFYMALTKKYKIESLILGLFSFIPYMAAMFSVLFSMKMNWKPTNAVSGDIITKILLPAILYIVVAGTLFYITLLNQHGVFTPYLFWMGVDVLLFAFLIFEGYFAKPFSLKGDR